jgi:hypothetical protein
VLSDHTLNDTSRIEQVLAKMVSHDDLLIFIFVLILVVKFLLGLWEIPNSFTNLLFLSLLYYFFKVFKPGALLLVYFSSLGIWLLYVEDRIAPKQILT